MTYRGERIWLIRPTMPYAPYWVEDEEGHIVEDAAAQMRAIRQKIWRQLSAPLKNSDNDKALANYLALVKMEDRLKFQSQKFREEQQKSENQAKFFRTARRQLSSELQDSELSPKNKIGDLRGSITGQDGSESHWNWTANHSPPGTSTTEELNLIFRLTTEEYERFDIQSGNLLYDEYSLAGRRSVEDALDGLEFEEDAYRKNAKDLDATGNEILFRHNLLVNVLYQYETFGEVLPLSDEDIGTLDEVQVLKNENRIYTSKIQELKNRNKALERRTKGRPTREQLKAVIDECRFANGRVNFSAVGKRLAIDGKTAKRWIQTAGLLQYAEGVS